MSSKDNAQELSELLTAAKDHFSYLGELGIEHVEIPLTLPDIPAISPTKKLSPASIDRLPGQAAALTSATVPSPAKAPQVSSEVLFGDLAPPSPKLERSSETFEEIQTSVGDCTRCPLSQQRTHIVHTEGNRQARLMFVGEAPGADEDFQARPFVGRAGQLLTKIIEAIGFRREEVLIGNINRCRPPGNRPPTAEE